MHRDVVSAARVARSGTDFPSRLVGATGAGALLGFVVDQVAGIFPWGLVVGLFLGALVGTYEVVLLYNQAMDREQARRGTERPV